MVMRGWINLDEDFSKHVIYNHQARDLFHLWSAKNFGYTFGEQEYGKFLSMREFLDMPVDFLADLLEGYGRGTRDLIKANQEAAKRAAEEAKRKAGSSKAEQAAIASAQRGEK